MKKILTMVFVGALLAGCLKHRDIYDYAGAMLTVSSSWSPSLGLENNQDATLVFYRDGAVYKEYFSRPNSVTTRVENGGIYDLVVMNGIIEAEDNTHLDHLYLRGYDNLATLEAYIAPGTSNKRIGRADGEYVASNEMDMFTVACGEVEISGEEGYFIRYTDGQRAADADSGISEISVEMTPRAVTYRFQVTLTNIINPQSAAIGNGTLKGLAGSAFLSMRHHGVPRSNFEVSHHLNFIPPTDGALRTDGDGTETGTAASQVFVSFGPALPESVDNLPSSGCFFFEPLFVLMDNREFRLDAPIDVTPQVNAAIRKIHAYHSGEVEMPFADNFFNIEISDPIELPVVKHSGGVVDVTPWGDEEIIMIWI